MAIVETKLSDCYHNLIFHKFLQLGYQIPVKFIILPQMPKFKEFLCFFESTSFLNKNVLKEITDSGENGKHKLIVS